MVTEDGNQGFSKYFEEQIEKSEQAQTKDRSLKLIIEYTINRFK